MDPQAIFEMGLWRIAPLAMLTVALIGFGWWLRGESVKLLKEWIDELNRK